MNNQHLQFPVLQFGTDGIRGGANQGILRPEGMVLLGRVLAKTLNSADLPMRVVVGRDTRRSGAMLQAGLGAGFISEGGQVVLAGILPTPAISYLTVRGNFSLGIMITASHNPAHDNGIKIFDAGGAKISNELGSQIRSMWQKLIAVDWRFAPPITCSVGTTYRERYGTQSYIQFLTQSLPASASFAPWKIVVDCAHGATFQVIESMCAALKINASIISNNPNGDNINDGCGALVPTHVLSAVQQHQADIGIAFDGDGDRLVMVTPQRALTGDELLYLGAIALKESGELRENRVVITEHSGMGLIQSLQKQGVIVAITDIGDHIVVNKMRELRASFGGESSGHIIFAEYSATADAMLAALQILVRYPKERWHDLSTLLSGYSSFPRVEKSIPVSAKPSFAAVPELAHAIEQARTLLTTEGRLLVRYSGTEPKIRILAEHTTKTTAEDALQIIEQAVASCL